ncbi:hypothetical protein C5S39_11200 [Candidatus Methanophagaceae archaeon]|jgi:hypothetical protein|nr:hypothetical protein C5S39_11200 [Methanophagales archaeon]
MEHITLISTREIEARKWGFISEKKHIPSERLKNAVTGKVTNIVRRNRSRANCIEKLQKMIDEYNSVENIK